MSRAVATGRALSGHARWRSGNSQHDARRQYHKEQGAAAAKAPVVWCGKLGTGRSPVAELNGDWVCGNHRTKGRNFICQVGLPEGGIHCKFWLVEDMPKHGIWDYWWFLIGCNWFLTAATFSPKNGWCGDGKKNCRHLFMVFTGVY